MKKLKRPANGMNEVTTFQIRRKGQKISIAKFMSQFNPCPWRKSYTGLHRITFSGHAYQMMLTSWPWVTSRVDIFAYVS